MGLAIFFSVTAGGQFQTVDYASYATGLRMSSVSPGGWGTLRVTLRLPGGFTRVAHPELAIVSAHVTVMDGLTCCFSGEVQQAAMVLDTHGEAIQVVAAGGAVALADDPLDSAYTNATAGAIIADQLTRRAAYLAIDADQSAILPDAPVMTFAPVFAGRTVEDVLHELCDLLGDYIWGVWNHPSHRDAAGLPTWQLQVHRRDVTTVGYAAQSGDVVQWRIAPTATRAYNAVTLHYLDPITGPGAVTVVDSRLNGDLSQGRAPFRLRRFRRDMGQRILTAAQATALAGQYLASFSEVRQLVTLTLAQIRDATGRVIPLWQVRADRNIALPELLPRTNQLPASPGLLPGTNLFYIRQATYQESALGGKGGTVTLLLDQVADVAVADLERLRYEERLRQRSHRTLPTIQPGGVGLKGFWSIRWGASSGAGNSWGNSISFPSVLANIPTGLVFTVISQANIGTGPVITNATVWGCDVQVTTAVAGAGYWIGTYQTVGN